MKKAVKNVNVKVFSGNTFNITLGAFESPAKQPLLHIISVIVALILLVILKELEINVFDCFILIHLF